MAIRILIADDDALIRDGLRIILSLDPAFEVAAVAANGQEALDILRGGLSVDVALLDIRMPIMDGVTATRHICGENLARVLILTTFDEDAYIREAIRNGARGYLLKNNPPDRIKAAIRMVSEGGSVMEDLVLEKLREGLETPKTGKTPSGGGGIPADLFSERETEILSLIAKGLSNREISGTLFIGEGTVKNYITSILNKTGLEHRTQLAIWWLNGGKLGQD